MIVATQMSLNAGWLRSPLLSVPADLGGGLRAVTEQRAKARADQSNQRLSLSLLVLNAVAICVSIVSLEVSYVAPNVTQGPADCAGSGSYSRSYSLPLCAVNFGLTLVSWTVLIAFYARKYNAAYRLDLLPRDPLATGRSAPPFWRGHMLRGFLLEALVLSIQPVPWLPALWYELLSLAVGCRVYLVVRAVRDMVRARMQGRLPRLSHVPWRVALKLLYTQHPLPCLGVAFLYSFFELSFVLHVVERDCNPEFSDFGNACWLIIVTMTTVGYGDISPIDPLGRVVASIACVWGIVMLACFCLVITEHLSLSASEARLLRILQDQEMGRAEREAAATLIQQVWRTTLPQSRLATEERLEASAAARQVESEAARRRLGLPEIIGTEDALLGGRPMVRGGVRVATGREHQGCGGGEARNRRDSARAIEAAAAAARPSRLSLLHRVQKQRESRQLFALQEESGELLMRRLEAMERKVASEMEDIRRSQAAHGEMLGSLLRQLAQATAPNASRATE